MTRMYYLNASADMEQEDKGTVISTRFYTKITLIDRVTGETKEFKTERACVKAVMNDLFSIAEFTRCPASKLNEVCARAWRENDSWFIINWF